jgi:peptidoglycan/LPS O-acetylase OafA/YrhL
MTTQHRNNSFDLLRLILSISVLLSHAIYLLSNNLIDPGAWISKNQINMGQLSVLFFFGLSGYLITESFLHSKNYLQFLCNRVLRILPGFWVALLLTGFIIAPTIFYVKYKNIDTYSFTGIESALSYFYKNALLGIHQHTIAGIESVHYNPSGAINGSLWTLYPEFQCYIFTLIAGIFGLFDKNKFSLILLSIIGFLFYMVQTIFGGKYGPTFIMLTPYVQFYITYLCGTLMCIFNKQLIFDKKGKLFLFIVTLLLFRFGGFMSFAPVLITLLAINIFSSFSVPLKFDVSYGVYIYAFPITILAHYALPDSMPLWMKLVFILIITLIFSLLSFTLVERPFLKLKSRFAKFGVFNYFNKT